MPEACTRTPGAWLQMQMDALALGRKTGRGFYSYEAGKMFGA